MEKYKNTELTVQERAEDIVSKMTLEEQVSQLRYDAFEIERLGLPAYNWWNESLHGIARAGTATMFPQAIGLAAIFDENSIKTVGDICAVEARAKYNVSRQHGDRGIYKGLTMWSPNINIFRDPRWGRGQETYGECPYLTSRLGVSFAKALQGDQPVLKVAACAKHYAGHSGPEGIRHQFNAKISDKDLNETYLPAFEALVREAKVESVMGAYNRVNLEPACASDYLMGKLKAWGFEGHFVSDCWAIRDFHTHHKITKTPAESAALALNKGCDLNCGNTYQHLLEALEEGLVSREVVAQSAVRLMKTRIKLGMLDAFCEFDNIEYDQVSCDTHKAYALVCAQKSMVLLKNNGLLPLDQTQIQKIAVIGPNAASIEALRGNYYGTGDEYWTFLDGIRNAFSGRIYYSEGCHLFSSVLQALGQPGDGYSEAITAAQHSDVVVLCVGLDATIEGEEGDTGNAFAAGDKQNLFLPKSQRKLVEQILALNKPTIIVNASGSSINVLGDRADAIIQTWYPGQMGGKALADILFGKISPSGKLPVTFYETADLLPDFEDYDMTNRTYRYVEDNVLYPFGYGLTYSKVVCSDLKFDPDHRMATVDVVNQGNCDTDEVVQLYIRCEDSKYEVRNHKLCGFKRIHIKSNESIKVDIQVSESAFKVVNDKGEWIVDGSRFTLYAGVNQPDDLSKQLTGQSCLHCEFQL
ncbi:glycoside hydrolase family 3 C-terminal domain-containing protein [Fusibacter sp. 3D3]|uniref:glycoside hydrolase family 3 C-terminal domain-containing protein n=1 Tax=Fusibacter sp. 3D3 TaxID=1048380 RepID=UPI00085370E4|nr:glycoside hydrolase family 3 C-terminal domain-containing protein [Fusibacter sp. 3D3]GAU79159.1 beta-glucosidase [Fusibacter sp. 3D3]